MPRKNSDPATRRHSSAGVVVGPPKVEAGCPPPDVWFVSDGEPPGRVTDQVCVSDLVMALDDIERWIADIRRVLQCLPPDVCIECPSKKGSFTKKKAPAKKAAAKKVPAKAKSRA